MTATHPESAPRIAASQKITPSLWFDDRIEAAANFYVSVFEDSRILGLTRYPEGGPRPAGTVLTAQFELAGLRFIAINGGPHFKFTPAVSFTVHCTDQREVDHYWTALTAGGGQESQCGWLTDRFGLSWQIVPDALVRYLGGKDAQKAARVMAAMMQMRKIDIAALDRAYAG
ncbi:MAG TPA: VOC family protein [Tepidisphaeraceae bacterium]|nr:VOC family protein [Tepidisphaeraceae bacterium]